MEKLVRVCGEVPPPPSLDSATVGVSAQPPFAPGIRVDGRSGNRRATNPHVNSGALWFGHRPKSSASTGPPRGGGSNSPAR